MNLLIISPSFYPAAYYGGPISSTYEIAKTLKKKNIDVKVITTNANGNKKLKVNTGEWHKLENELPVKYYLSLDSRGTSLSMFLNLWKEIRYSEIIYLISIFSPPTPATIFTIRLLKKPLIISPRGQLGEWCLNQGNVFKKIWLKVLISPVANKIIWEATSIPEKEMILNLYPKAKVEVIPAIIDIEKYSDAKEKDYTIYKKLTGQNFEGKKIIVSMGRLHKVKGFDILIEAMSKVLKETKHKGKSDDIVLLIAGEDFGERKNLEHLIDKLLLKEKIFLVGNLEGSDKIEFLRNADLFALASRHENFGIVYAEALAAGIPVIASKNTPWSDVEKYDCGLWVESIPEAYSNAITELLQKDLPVLGKNGRQFISENFSCEKTVIKFKNIIESFTIKR